MLPYLELKKDNEIEEDKVEEVEVPEIRNKTIKEAIAILKEQELEIENTFEEEIKKDETYIKEQFPKPGLKVRKGSKITVEI